MNQYIVLIQGNATTTPAADEWNHFFTLAGKSGNFQGGSVIGQRTIVGNAQSAKPTAHVVGYMRFDSDAKDELLDLLKNHPVVMHGGSIELCELPESPSLST